MREGCPVSLPLLLPQPYPGPGCTLRFQRYRGEACGTYFLSQGFKSEKKPQKELVRFFLRKRGENRKNNEGFSLSWTNNVDVVKVPDNVCCVVSCGCALEKGLEREGEKEGYSGAPCSTPLVERTGAWVSSAPRSKSIEHRLHTQVEKGRRDDPEPLQSTRMRKVNTMISKDDPELLARCPGVKRC
jgi:hypothetical protein